MTYISGVSACNVCGGDLITYEGEWVCRSCGAVPARVDGEPTITIKQMGLTDLKDMELGSFLGTNSPAGLGGYSGFDFEFSTPAYMKTLSDFGLRSRTLKTQSYVLDIVARLGESINLPRKAILDAQHMAATRLRQDRVKKGSLPTLAAYCVVVAARRVGRNTTSWKKVSKNLSLMGHKVKLSSLICIATNGPIEQDEIRMEEYLKDAVRNLVGERYVRDGIELCHINLVRYQASLLKKAESMMGNIGPDAFSGYNPIAAAATLLYMAEDALSTEEGRRKIFTQKMAAQLLGISEYTVREQTAKFKRQIAPIALQPQPIAATRTDY